MGSPRKSQPVDSGSPRLARFIAGSVRRRQSLSSKKSSNTETASGSTQVTWRKWSPKKQNQGRFELDVDDRTRSRDTRISANASTSSSNHVRHQSVDGIETSSLGSPNEKELASFTSQMDGHIADRNRQCGVLLGTPPSGVRSFRSNLPSPSPRPRSSLSRVHSLTSRREGIETTQMDRSSPSTMGTASAGCHYKLDVQDLDHKIGNFEPASSATHNSAKQERDISDPNKSTEKRSNRKSRATFDFLSINNSRGVLKRNAKQRFDSSVPAAAEEPSSPLLARSLTDQILARQLGADRSETAVICSVSGEFPLACESRNDMSQGECVEVVRVNNDDSLHMVTSIKSTSERDEFMQIMRRNRSASELHSLCACMTTIDDVLRARSFFVGMSRQAVSQRDYKGETPMHAFANNKTLAVQLAGNSEFETKDFLVLYRQPTFDQESSNHLHEHISTFLLEELLPSYPGAMMIQDNKGFIPFEEGLLDWIATTQKQYDIGAGNDHYSIYLSSYTNAVSDAVSNAWKSTSTTFMTAMSKMTESDCQRVQLPDLETGENESLKESSSKDELTGDKNDPSHCSSKSKLSPHARFCLQMLSLIVEQLELIAEPTLQPFDSGIHDERGLKRRQVKGLHEVYGPLDLASQIVERVACIPNLLRTILSITEEIDVEFAIRTTIIRRVLLDRHSVGPWLTSMLQNPHRSVSRRAIDYLQNVSKLCREQEKTNGRNKNTSEQACEDVIDEVSRLPDFVPSLLSLGENGMEEASTTKVVSDVLDKMISRPFVATVVLCDAIFLALMIVGFRYAVNGIITGGSLEKVLSWIYVANTGIFYFLIQEIGKAVSLLLISSHSRKYFLSFWNVVDVLAIVLALLSSMAMRWQFAIHRESLDDSNPLRGLLAISTGFLWLRVLSFLKSINIQLATFILAIITITKDILFFCVILLILVISFSQMFFTLLAPTSCATETASTQQCSQTEYLLQFYIMMLGDFGNSERESFTTGFSVFLMVLYSFLVTVILLNVLIAIAGDSYEKCLLNSQKLFGRARVMLVAELVSFQSLLRKRDHQADQSDDDKKVEDGVYSHWWMSGNWSWTRKWSRGSILFFGLSMFVTFVWTIAEVVGFAKGDRYVSTIGSLSSVFINIALYVTIILFLGRNSVSTKSDGDSKKEWSNSLQRVVLRVLGASEERKKEMRKNRRKGQEEWHGRVQFLQREMDRIAEKQSELLNEQSEDFQNMVHQSESRLRSELSAIEERFRETNHSIVSVVDELKALLSIAGSSVPGGRSPVPEEVELNYKK